LRMNNFDSEVPISLCNPAMGINREEFSKVPYIHHVPADGRTVFLAPYIDRTDNKWKTHVPKGRELAWIFAEPVESCYYAESIADQTKDVYIEIMDVVARYYSFDSVLRTSWELLTRIVKCAVVLEKYFLWLSHFRRTNNILLANLVETDLEFLFANVRSTYDLMQIILTKLWKKPGRPELKKDSFAEMVLMNRSDLEKYGLPKSMIDYYLSSKDFFLKVRKIRDGIFHHKATAKADMRSMVFCDVEGFALAEEHLFADVTNSASDIWPREKVKPNGLVSILALISYITKKTVQATEGFSRTLTASIVPLEPISKSYRLFLRSPYVPHLLKVDRYLNEQWIEGDVTHSLMS
jgi:hypothetical protein